MGRQRWFRAIFVVAAVGSVAHPDDLLYRYEGDVLPYPDAGWLWGGCEGPCSESLADGYFRLDWDVLSHQTNYHLWIAQAGETPPPPPFWVEWRFRSDQPFTFVDQTCDADFHVQYQDVSETWYMFGDAVISQSGDDVRLFTRINEFRTFRFESPDGVNFCLWTDGELFNCGTDHKTTGSHYVQMRGEGACSLDVLPTVNEWDFVRYGTVDYGETIVASDPPAGFVDARTHAPLDRFTVTFDAANYVYVDEISVEVAALTTEPLSHEALARASPATQGTTGSYVFGTEKSSRAAKKLRVSSTKDKRRNTETSKNQNNTGDDSFSIPNSAFAIPVVVATRRLDNGPPEVVESSSIDLSPTTPPRALPLTTAWASMSWNSPSPPATPTATATRTYAISPRSKTASATPPWRAFVSPWTSTPIPPSTCSTSRSFRRGSSGADPSMACPPQRSSAAIITV
jgi:hypothetical protein